MKRRFNGINGERKREDEENVAAEYSVLNERIDKIDRELNKYLPFDFLVAEKILFSMFLIDFYFELILMRLCSLDQIVLLVSNTFRLVNSIFRDRRSTKSIETNAFRKKFDEVFPKQLARQGEYVKMTGVIDLLQQDKDVLSLPVETRVIVISQVEQIVYLSRQTEHEKSQRSADQHATKLNVFLSKLNLSIGVFRGIFLKRKTKLCFYLDSEKSNEDLVAAWKRLDV